MAGPVRFQRYYAHCLGAALAGDPQQKLTAETLAARAAAVALAALREEDQHYPGTAPTAEAAPAPARPIPRPPPPPIAPATTGAPFGSTVASNGLVQPPAGSIPGWHGDPGAAPIAPPASAGGAPTVVKIPVANAINAPLTPDSLCPACRGYRKEPSLTDDTMCGFLHFAPYGNLATPAAPATMSSGE